MSLLPYFFNAAGEIMAAEGWASELMKSANGSFNVIRTLNGVNASTEAIRLNWL